MHEVNISPLLSLARFFLTQQLIYEKEIEKDFVCLDIFIPHQKPSSAWIEEKTF